MDPLEDRLPPGTVIGGVLLAALADVPLADPVCALAAMTGDVSILFGPRVSNGVGLERLLDPEGAIRPLKRPLPLESTGFLNLESDEPPRHELSVGVTNTACSPNDSVERWLDDLWSTVGYDPTAGGSGRPMAGSEPRAPVEAVGGSSSPIQLVRFVGLGGAPTPLGTDGPSEFNLTPGVEPAGEPDEPPVGPGEPLGGEVPEVTVTADDPTASEVGPSTGVFRLTREGDLGLPLTVTYQLVQLPDSATNGVDFQTLSGSVTFPADAEVADVLVTPIPDGLVDEGPETVTLQVVDGFDYTAGTPDQATVTILDDGPAAVSVYAQTPVAAEGGGAGQFLFVRTGDTTLDLTVDYTVGGTAEPAGPAGADHNLAAAGSVVIPADSTHVTLTVSPVNDSTVEPPESVVLSVGGGPSGGGDYYASTPSSATVMIVDDDVLPYVSVVASTPYGFEGSTGGTFTFTRTGSTAQPLTVTIASNEYGMDPVAATPGVDYVALPTFITFDAGHSTKTLTIQTIENTFPELPETVTVRIVPGVDYQTGLPSTVTATIVDNDVPSPSGGSGGGSNYVLSVSAVDPSGSETGPNHAMFRLTRSGIPFFQQTLQSWEWTLQGSSASGFYGPPGPSGGGDYDRTPFLNITFPEGSATVDVPVTVYDDGIVEGPETVILSTMGSGGWSKAVAVIEDDDTVPVINVEPAGVADERGEIVGKFRVTRTGGLGWSVTVPYTIGGSATPDLGDHKAMSAGQIEFSAMQTEAFVEIPPVDDAQIEGPEAVALALAGTTGGSIGFYVGNAPQAGIAVLDGDNVVSIAAADPDSSESGPSTGAFAITRVADMTQGISVLDSVEGTAHTADQKQPDHDLPSSATVTFNFYEGRKVVILTPVDDAFGEVTEIAEMSIVPGLGYAVGTSPAEVRILDNDPVELDLDVDSDNDDGFGRPDLTKAEDKIEDVEGDPTKPGKLIPANNEDKDEDGVPDFADGYSLSLAAMPAADKTNTAKANASENFVQMVLTVPSASWDISQAHFILSYDASNPLGVTYDAQTKTYTPASGGMRVWTQPGNALRNPNSIKDATPGHYVPPGSNYLPADFGLDPNAQVDQEVTFYIEGITVSGSVADQGVSIGMDGEPAGIGNLQDQVACTIVDQLVTLAMPGNPFVPLNANNDNGSAVANELPATRDFNLAGAALPTAFADAELQKVNVSKASVPAPLNLPGTYTLTIKSAYLIPGPVVPIPPTGRVRVWSDQNKTTEFTSGTTWTHLNVPTSMYVEGMEPTLGLTTPTGDIIPDVRLELKFEWDIIPGVKVLLARAKQDVTVTPVITRYETLPGKLVVVSPAVGSLGLIATAKGVLPGQPGFTNSGADTHASLFAANMPGIGGVGQINIGQLGPILIQNGGYVGADAVVNGDGAALPDGFTVSTGATAKAFLRVGGVAGGANLPQVLDRAGKGNPPTPPDYAATIQNVGNSMFTVYAQDNPGWAWPALGAKVPGLGTAAAAGVIFDEAIRDNFRVHLLWRYPAAGGKGTTIYPLAKLDWSVFFRGNGNLGPPAGAGFFAPTAAAVVTTNPYVISHEAPNKLAPPDFNDSMVIV
jgi:hypothetical protein